jgi:hypothetical protein
MLIALARWNQPLVYASESLRSDREIVLLAFTAEWEYDFALDPDEDGLLQYVSQELRGDREVALLAVQMGGINLQYVSDDLKADCEFVMEAIEQHGWALEYASDDLQNDPELIAIRDAWQALSDDDDDVYYLDRAVREREKGAGRRM